MSRHKRISPTTKPTIIIVLLFSNYVIRNQNLTQVTVSKPRASLDLTGNKYNGETKRTTFRQKTVRCIARIRTTLRVQTIYY